jgi:hypothetical protein
MADVDGFWKWFEAHHEEILEIMGGRRDGKVTDMVDKALEQHRLNLTYDITEGVKGAELTFTPMGDANVAAFIDALLAKAPKLDTWVMHGRTQRKSLTAALAFIQAVYAIDLADLHFKVKQTDEKYHLLFLSDPLAALPEEKRFEVAASFLDHALGEDLAMEIIGSVDFKPARPGGIEMGLVINQIIREMGASTGDLPPIGDSMD